MQAALQTQLGGFESQLAEVEKQYEALKTDPAVATALATFKRSIADFEAQKQSLADLQAAIAQLETEAEKLAVSHVIQLRRLPPQPPQPPASLGSPRSTAPPSLPSALVCQPNHRQHPAPAGRQSTVAVPPHQKTQLRACRLVAPVQHFEAQMKLRLSGGDTLTGVDGMSAPDLEHKKQNEALMGIEKVNVCYNLSCYAKVFENDGRS